EHSAEPNLLDLPIVPPHGGVRPCGWGVRFGGGHQRRNLQPPVFAIAPTRNVPPAAVGGETAKLACLGHGRPADEPAGAGVPDLVADAGVVEEVAARDDPAAVRADVDVPGVVLRPQSQRAAGRAAVDDAGAAAVAGHRRHAAVRAD